MAPIRARADTTWFKKRVRKRWPYSVAFVDMHMPLGWDGIETIEHLWRIDPDLYIVICAAFSDHDWARVRDRMPQHDKLLVLRKPYEAIEVWQ